MRAIVVKPFPYSADGLTVLQLEPDPDQPVNIRDDLAPGLLAEGWISAVGGDTASPPPAGDQAVAGPAAPVASSTDSDTAVVPPGTDESPVPEKPTKAKGRR